MKIFNKSEWKKVKLKDICDILDSRRIPISEEKRIKGKYPYYGANGIQGYINDYIFDEELVLLAEDGGNFGSKIKPIAYKINGKTWVNNHAHVLKAKNEIISTDFLLYSLMFYDVTKLITGTTRKKLTRTGMEKITLFIPNLDMQEKITNYLQEIEKFISLRKNQLNYLKELVKSLFTRMFGDIEKKFKLYKLSDICDVRDGTHDSPEYIMNDKRFPLITSKNLKEGKIDFNRINKRSKVDVGDILMPMIGTIGNPIIVKTERSFSIKNLALIKFNNSQVKNIFLKFLLLSDFFYTIMSQKNKGGTQKFLSLNDIRNFLLPVPPIELQNKFAERVEKIEKLSFEIEKSIKEAENLYNSLINKYFE